MYIVYTIHILRVIVYKSYRSWLMYFCAFFHIKCNYAFINLNCTTQTVNNKTPVNCFIFTNLYF